MKLFALFILFAAIVVAEATVAQIKADISVIASRIHSLHNSVEAFPTRGGTPAQGLAIRTDTENLNAALKRGTSDAKTTSPFSTTDARAVLSDVNSFVPTFLDVLEIIIKKKEAFANLGFPGVLALIRQGLEELRASSDPFSTTLINLCPRDVQGDAKATRDKLDRAVANAISAYS